MLKSQLIEQLAARFHKHSVPEITHAVNTILGVLTESLCLGHRIEIRDFGSFAVHHYPPRKAHNPKTGEYVMAEANVRPRFKPGKKLKERVGKS